MIKNCFLVTGAQDFIGIWVIKNLLEKGQDVIAFDVEGADFPGMGNQ